MMKGINTMIREIKEEEMKTISGGNFESPVINAITNTLEFIYNLGKELGSGIRRLIDNNYCPMG